MNQVGLRTPCHQGKSMSICTDLSMLRNSETRDSVNTGTKGVILSTTIEGKEILTQLPVFGQNSQQRKRANMTLLTGFFESISCIIFDPTYEDLSGINVLYACASCFIVQKVFLLTRNSNLCRNASTTHKLLPNLLPTTTWVIQHNQYRMPRGEMKNHDFQD